MKRILSRILLLSAAAAILASCFPDEEYMYTDIGMCTLLSASQLLTDNGEIYNIAENNSGYLIPDTLKRIMTRCDVLAPVPGKSNEYNVRLMEFADAFCSEPFRMSTLDEELVGTDGVSIDQAWHSGGYLNAHAVIAMYDPSKVDHTLNLVYDDIRSNSDTLFFEVRHNAFGECPENPDTNLSYFVFAGTYLSFPTEGILENGRTPVIHLEWEWYDIDGYLTTREKKRASGDITVK